MDTGNTSDNLNSIAKKIISENEGGYGGVNPKDGKGASASLSVGKFQWHSERAHDLLNRIKVKIESSNPEQVKIILQGTTLYSELGRDRSIFKARILNSTETKAVSKLLQPQRESCSRSGYAGGCLFTSKRQKMHNQQ